MLDQGLSMSCQVSAVIKSCNYHLRNISKIRPYISTDACKDAVQTLIMSRIDYCSSLLCGISQYDIGRLQRLQNRALRVITRLPMSHHITPILAELHWLPIHLRIRFRLLVFIYKCLHSLAPSYLVETVSLYVPRRRLRSSYNHVTLVPQPPLKKVGTHAFSSCATLWNELPVAVREVGTLAGFKRTLKTTFFIQYYS